MNIKGTMNIKGSEPHRRLEVLAAVKDSFSLIGQGDCRPQIGQQIKIQIHSEVSSGRVNIISLPSSSISCTENSTTKQVFKQHDKF